MEERNMWQKQRKMWQGKATQRGELGWGPAVQPSLTSLGRLGLDCLRTRRPLLGGTGVLPSSRSTRPSSRAWNASRVSDFLRAHTVCTAAARLSSDTEPLLHLSLTPQTSTCPRHRVHCNLSLSPSLQSLQLSHPAASSISSSHYSLSFSPCGPSHPTHLPQDTSLVPVYVPSCPMPPTLEPFVLLQPRPKQHGTSWHPRSFPERLLQYTPWIPGESLTLGAGTTSLLPPFCGLPHSTAHPVASRRWLGG